jgi:phospholipase/carboxylesterase
MLEFDHLHPENTQDGDPLIVALHGRGSDKGDLIGLARHLPPNAMLVAPRAPFPGAQWGYGGGWAWYQFMGGTTASPETFTAGQAALADFMQRLPEELPAKPGKTLIGGFSQGGSTSLAYATLNPGKVAGVFVFSGLVLSDPAMQSNLTNLKGLPIFWGHGRHDPMIPFATAQTGVAALRAAGADVATFDYPMAHTIAPKELDDWRNWLDAVLKG